MELQYVYPYTLLTDLILNFFYINSLLTDVVIFLQGWINDENPLEKASKIAKNNHFQTPIDEIDAAARICDPIFTGVRIDLDKHEDESKKCKPPCKDYGKFLKDYRETEW